MIILALHDDATADDFQFSTLDEFQYNIAQTDAKRVDLSLVDAEFWQTNLWDEVQPGAGDLAAWFKLVGKIESVSPDDEQDVFAAAAYHALSVSGEGEALAVVAEGDFLERYKDAVGIIKFPTEDAVRQMIADGTITAVECEPWFEWVEFGDHIADEAMNLAIADARDRAADEGKDEDDAEQGVVDWYNSMSLRRIAEEYIKNIGGLQELDTATLESFTNVERFARAMEGSHELQEFVFNGESYTATRPNGWNTPVK